MFFLFPFVSWGKLYSLLWETLTGREHLLFYGRLKNLKGAALTQVSQQGLYFKIFLLRFFWIQEQLVLVRGLFTWKVSMSLYII